MTPTLTTHGLVTFLRAIADDDESDRADRDIAQAAADRLQAQLRLLDRASDLIAYHTNLPTASSKWLLDAKEIGIEPCPF